MFFEMRAEEYYQDHQGKIYGREYIENGIFLMFPKPETRQEKLL